MLDMDILADQIGQAFRGKSWHGPSVCEVLEGVSADDAAAYPIPDAHSIWEIVLHLISGYKMVLRRVNGEEAPYSADDAWPEVTDFSTTAWRENLDTLAQLNDQLERAVRDFPADRLAAELGSQFPAYLQFCGAPQHDLYHAGQIVMLKKALAASRSASPSAPPLPSVESSTHLEGGSPPWLNPKITKFIAAFIGAIFPAACLGYVSQQLGAPMELTAAAVTIAGLLGLGITLHWLRLSQRPNEVLFPLLFGTLACRLPLDSYDHEVAAIPAAICYFLAGLIAGRIFARGWNTPPENSQPQGQV